MQVAVYIVCAVWIFAAPILLALAVDGNSTAERDANRVINSLRQKQQKMEERERRRKALKASLKSGSFSLGRELTSELLQAWAEARNTHLVVVNASSEKEADLLLPSAMIDRFE